MLTRNRRGASTSWKRKRSQYSNSCLLSDDPSFHELKTMSKRLAIMSRLQNKQGRAQKVSQTQTYSKLNIDETQPSTITQDRKKRPATTNQTKVHNFKSIRQAFKEEKKVNEVVIAEKYGATVKTAMSNGSVGVKEGLLGEYERYNEMSKQELIEKLISLEYLANNIFRKNKALEQRIKAMDPNNVAL